MNTALALLYALGVLAFLLGIGFYACCRLAGRADDNATTLHARIYTEQTHVD